MAEPEHDRNAEEHQHADGDHGRGTKAPDPAPAARGPDDLLAAERTAYQAARPVFERYCASCHTAAGVHPQRRTALPHFDMDSYPFGGHHATEMAATIREVLGATGEDATMPKDNPGVVQGDDLALVLAWADAFERSHKAGLHDHEHGKTHKH